MPDHPCPPGGTEEAVGGLLGLALHADQVSDSSGETRRARRTGWSIYIQWAQDKNVDVLSATAETGQAYLNYLEERYAAPASVLSRLAQARALYHFWHQMGLTTVEPFTDLTPPANEPAARRRVFSPPEVKRLLIIRGNEDQAFLLFGLRLGLKARTLISLTWEQLDLGAFTVRLTATGSPLPLDRSTGQVLQRLAIQRQAQGRTLQGQILPFHDTAAVNQRLQALCVQVKVKPRNWPVLRNTGGIWKSKQTDPGTLQQVMEFKSDRSVAYLNEKRGYEEGRPVDNIKKIRRRSRR